MIQLHIRRLIFTYFVNNARGMESRIDVICLWRCGTVGSCLRMNTMHRCLAIAGLLLLGTNLSRADDPSAAQPWSFDTITLKNGTVLKGLILESSDSSIKIQCVLRQAGRPTVTLHTAVQRAEIVQVDRLKAPQREQLQARLLELEQNTPQGEKARMEGLNLEEIAWAGQPKGGLRYKSDYFTLESNAPEDIVRRSALRLEQIFAAYAVYLPSRFKGGAPTSVTLMTDEIEYRRMLVTQKQQFQNLAFFDPASNRIVCFSSLKLLGERLALLRFEHRKLRSDLEAKRTEFAKLYKGKELARVTMPITDALRRLDRVDQQNAELLDKESRQLLATLYHEAFHAYLAVFVYPPQKGELPRWLNEGLAQIFESAIVEGKELRVGHADATRLTRVKEKNALVPLADLLRSGPKQFLVSHAVERQSSDRNYLTSWALAFYLTFEKRLLGSAAMDRFVARLHEGIDPIAAFEEFSGASLTAFEVEFRKYVQLLQEDGTVAKVVKP